MTHEEYKEAIKKFEKQNKIIFIITNVVMVFFIICWSLTVLQISKFYPQASLLLGQIHIIVISIISEFVISKMYEERFREKGKIVQQALDYLNQHKNR